MKTVSIVTTLFNSENFIIEFYKKCREAVEVIQQDYEFILVDDGSSDDSLKKAISLSLKDPKVTVVELSKNFGHHKAMLTAMSYAKGDYIFALDSDLEEDPMLLVPFFQKMHQEKCDAVYGIQKRRKGNFFEKLTGNVFYFLINKFSDIQIPKNISTIRLANKQYCRAVSQYHEKVVYMQGIWTDLGFKQVPYEFDKKNKGSTEYTIFKKIAAATDSITSFSQKPLKFIFYIGLSITFISLFLAAYIFMKKILFKIEISGWASLFVSIWLVAGITFSFLGLLGIYLSRIFVEVKDRPRAIVRKIHNQAKESELLDPILAD